MSTEKSSGHTFETKYGVVRMYNFFGLKKYYWWRDRIIDVPNGDSIADLEGIIKGLIDNDPSLSILDVQLFYISLHAEKDVDVDFVTAIFSDIFEATEEEVNEAVETFVRDREVELDVPLTIEMVYTLAHMIENGSTSVGSDIVISYSSATTRNMEMALMEKITQDFPDKLDS